jgi:hypothetical protein
MKSQVCLGCVGSTDCAITRHCSLASSSAQGGGLGRCGHALVLFVGTKRIVGRETASQIASASAPSFLLRLMYAFKYCAGISRTSWPSAPNSRRRRAA